VEVTIASGHTIQIDEADAPLLEQHAWRAYSIGGKLRVVTAGPRSADDRRTVLQMSRLITGAPARRPIHHKNGDPLDLRRANLHVGGRYTCPFTGEQLRKLHQEEGRSHKEIARLSAEAAGWQTPPPRSTVNQWLRQAAVPLRVAR
jgi:hypothetical protein